jgi:hypothetical protein
MMDDGDEEVEPYAMTTITPQTMKAIPSVCAILLSLRVAVVSSYNPFISNKAPVVLPSLRQTDGGIITSTRRTALAHIAALTATLSIPNPAISVDGTSQLQLSLEARSVENSLSAPPYGMEATDIFYPPSFLGNWKVLSRTVDIIAPCGYELFTGGKAGFDNAFKAEVTGGDALEYKARFVSRSEGSDSGETYIVADREYNAREIAKAAMGSYSVIDTPIATPNRYSCLLAPPDGTSNLISVDILAIGRKTDPISPDKFVCAEFVRQIVSPVQRSNPNAPPTSPLSVKEIETISIYNLKNEDKIECRQRTATYLVPSQTDPVALRKWQLSQGQPVDVRYYDVIYTRVV